MVLNCVKWPKGNTQYLITREMVRTMEPGSVIVDISNDEQGLWRPSMRPRMRIRGMWKKGWYTTVSATFRGQLPILRPLPMRHPCFPHFRSILNLGVAEACARDGFLRRSLTAYQGYLTHEETSALQNRPWIRPEDILGISDRADWRRRLRSADPIIL